MTLASGEQMNYETVHSIGRMLEIGYSLQSALWLGSLFVWAVGFYILYQMYRLRFLMILLVSEGLFVAQWLWLHRNIFFKHSETTNYDDSIIFRMLFFDCIDFAFRFIPIAVATIGAVMAVRYLQQKWKETDNSQQHAGQVSSEGAPSTPPNEPSA